MAASFWTQANALLRKNLIFQKRNRRTSLRIVVFPIILCVLLVLLQSLINNELHKSKYKCGCACVDTNGNGSCETVCGIQYSTPDQVDSCSIPSPIEWPVLLQVPRQEYRAVKTGFETFAGLPEKSCRESESCPVTVLFTGDNESLANSLAANLFINVPSSNLSDYLSALSEHIPGTDTLSRETQFIEPAFIYGRPVYTIQPQCSSNSTRKFSVEIDTVTLQEDFECVRGLPLWCRSSSDVNDELFKGYRKGNAERMINEVMSAYDFLETNNRNFHVNVWYNSTYQNSSVWDTTPGLLRVLRSINVVSNAYLQFLRGGGVKMLLEFTKEMPKAATQLSFDFSSLLGALFFKWVIELLLPVILTYLVYEKQHKLRIMMKMHGLEDGAYWAISYAYFVLLSTAYVVFFMVFGSLIGLKFFKLNDYSIQFVFYFTYINLQIVLAFLATTFFSDVKTAQAIAYIYIFGTGFVGGYLLPSFIQDTSFPKKWLIVMELLPAFSLYRGLYELSQYSFSGDYMGTHGMRWNDLSDDLNGMKDVLIIIVIEWLILLPFAYYIDKTNSGGRISMKGLLSVLHRFLTKELKNSQRCESGKVFIEMEKPDVIREREVVEHALLEPRTTHAVICDNLKKVYSGKDGNKDKFAVKGVSIALQSGECFGLLGPNGAGKTSLINMMIGLVKPTSGNTFVRGLNIQTEKDKVYSSMGVCPQNDMLWEMLTGREHLLFYGRLKNLKGEALMQAVDESLRSVNLFHGGIANKFVGKYSGGMKRRLSVAISLIGDPKVVYMDEPSTGLDPASRNNLWNVVKQAKQNRAIILTTHSMEEAEVLCDRLGIIVDGSLQCIGNPKELKARFGGYYVLTMATSTNEEHEVETLVNKLCPNAKKIYHVSGTQKFELPKQDVRIADVFLAVKDAKDKFNVQAWALADTTMEDVFIKVAREAGSI
ncbi:putative ABC-type sulfate transporter [Dioscorea sansibarensis]